MNSFNNYTAKLRYIAFIYSGFLFIPRLVRGLAVADSFYAIALRSFYLRQLEIIKGSIKPVVQTGEIKKVTFAYQNFLSIYICYRLLGRRLFVVISLLVAAFFPYCFEKGLFPDELCTIIYLSSSISLFIFAERGNYQTLGLIIGAIATSIFVLQENVYYYYFLINFVVIMLSVSAFVLMSVVSFILNGFDLFELGGLVAIALIYLGLNFLYIRIISKEKSIKITDTIVAAIRVFNFIGAKLRNRSSVRVVRERSYIAGLASSAPFLGYAIINWGTVSMSLSLIATVLIFVNQSKIFRLFDFHFIYFFFFTIIYILQTSEEYTGWLELATLFLVGTNPIVLYGLNKVKCEPECRATRICEPVFASKQKVLEIYKKIEEVVGRPRGMLFLDNAFGNTTEVNYNDIIGDKGLALEFFWDVLDSRRINYFPDWYQIFYTQNGLELYLQINHSNFSNFENWSCAAFSENDAQHITQNDKPASLVDMSQIFGADVVSSYFPGSSQMILFTVS